MIMELFKIFGTVGVKIDEASQALDQITSEAGETASTLGSKFEAAGSKVTAMGKAFAPVSLAAGAAGGLLLKGAKDTAAYTDNIDKMSQKLGISRKAYQEWDYILSQNGASIDSMKMGMKSLTSSLDTVSQSGSTAGTAFERLGISYDQLQGKSQEEVFEMTITALQGVQDETERAALANKLFGRSGQELAPLLNSGAGSVEELKQKAHELGLVLDDETIDAGVNMTDALDTMHRAFTTMGAGIASAVMPLITQFADYVSAHMPAITDKIKGLVEKFNNLSPTLKKVIALILPITAAISPVLMIVGKMITTVGKLIGTVTKVMGVMSKLFSLLMANPIVLIIAGIVALVAAFIYLWNHSEKFRKFWINLWNGIKTTVTTVWNAIKSFITTVVNAIKAVFIAVFNAIKTAVTLYFNAYKTIIVTVWNAIKLVVTTVINAIKTVIVTVFNAIKMAISTILNGIRSIFTTIWNGIRTFVSGAVAAIKNTVVTVFNAIKGSVSTIWNGIKTTITSVWNSIKTGVSNAVNGVKSTVSSAFNAIKGVASSAWNGIKTAIINPISAAKDKVSSILTALKNIFPLSIGKIFSNLKLPHISVSGGKAPYGIGGKGSLPSFSVSWYKKAMENPYMFTQPTIFDYNPVSGAAKGAGDAGDELMYGHGNLMTDIENAVANKTDTNDELESILSAFLAWMQSPNGLAKVMTDVLTDNVKFMLDDRQVGKVVRQYAG